MRISEALGLWWVELHRDAEPAYIELHSTKNGKPAFMPLTTLLREDVFTDEHIANLQTVGHPLWARDMREWVFPYKYCTVADHFERVCDIADVEWHNGLHVWRQRSRCGS
ncbi:MAG: hypothetical protein JWM72_1755 [Actinomycetia bacterium]|nr:hypothetical protein [Actinomycetes bacterium]